MSESLYDGKVSNTRRKEKFQLPFLTLINQPSFQSLYCKRRYLDPEKMSISLPSLVLFFCFKGQEVSLNFSFHVTGKGSVHLGNTCWALVVRVICRNILNEITDLSLYYCYFFLIPFIPPRYKPQDPLKSCLRLGLINET